MEKKRLRIVCAFLLAVACQWSAVAQTRIAVVTDTHVLAPELIINDGTAWQNEVGSDRKLIDYSQAVFDELVRQFKADKPDLLLLTGDLTKDGERVSHEYVVRGLSELKAAGVQVYVIPGNHDVDNGRARSFDGDQIHAVPNLNSAGFASLYADFGYSGSTRDPQSLSYACEPIAGLVLLAIDSHRGSLSTATLDWACRQADKAWREGKQVIAMMHHPLFPHIVGVDLLDSSFNIADYETVRNRLADAGVRVILTGHIHTSDIAKDWNADLSRAIYDVNTGSVISYPCDYRLMTLSADLQTLQVTTQSVTALPGNPDFGSMARTRFRESIKNIVTDKIGSLSTLLGKYVDDAATAAVIHAEGNEHTAKVGSKKATDYYMGIVNTVKTLDFLGLINNKLKEYNLSWDKVTTIVHSLMDDTSQYGTSRADQTDDRTLTIAMPDLTEGLTLAADGWSSYCSDRRLDLSLTADVTGYIVEAVTAGTVQLRAVGVVPAETGFLLSGGQGAALRLRATDAEADDVSGNLLTGVLTATAAPDNAFVLSAKQGTTGFYPVKPGLTIPARKAYLPVAAGGGARQLLLPSGEPTGISVAECPADDGFYTLQGTKVSRPSKGVYVSHGKLIIVK